MASSGFPQRRSQGAGGMSQAGPGQEVLDGPPPSPAMPMGGGGMPAPGAAPQMPSFQEMSRPMTAGTPGRSTSPEIVAGMMQSAETIYGLFDSMASIAPDLSNDFALLKDLLQQAMAKLLVNGGQVGNPAATGVNFPGGGFSSGSQ